MILFFPSRSFVSLVSSFLINSMVLQSWAPSQSAQLAFKLAIAVRIYDFLVFSSLIVISVSFYWGVKGIGGRGYFSKFYWEFLVHWCDTLDKVICGGFEFEVGFGHLHNVFVEIFRVTRYTVSNLLEIETGLCYGASGIGSFDKN